MNRTLLSKRHRHPHVCWALLMITETHGQPEPTDRGRGKENVVDGIDRYRYRCGCRHWLDIDSYAMKYDSAIKKETLPLVTTWMHLEGVTADTVRSHLCMKSEKYCTHRNRADWCLLGARWAQWRVKEAQGNKLPVRRWVSPGHLCTAW